MPTRSDFVYRYRLRNWAEYNRALKRRGSLTFWIDERAVEGWRCADAPGPHGGRPRIYADSAIESALVVKAVFHLSLRATQGFLESLVRLMRVDLPVPDYTTVSKRQAELAPCLETSATTAPRHVVIDSTGLKVFGAGEWYVRKHGMGKGRRRTWRKLHLGVDEETKEIVAVDLTTSGVHDGPNLPAVREQIEGDVGQVLGDKAYDSGRCYEAILARGAVPTIPPRRNARPCRAKDPPAYRQERDSVLETIRVEGRFQWRSSSGATRQSLAENAVSRFKTLVGIKLSARGLERQQVEAVVKCRVLNRMASLGMPRSERVLQR